MKQLDLFKPPYEYTGYLKPWLPALDRLRAKGLTKRQAVQKLIVLDGAFREAMKHKQRNSWSDGITMITALMNAIDRRRGQYAEPRWGTQKFDIMYGRACDEHAWLLRAEGLKYRVIAARFGVTVERARQRVHKFGRRLARAMRHTKATTTTKETNA